MCYFQHSLITVIGSKQIFYVSHTYWIFNKRRSHLRWKLLLVFQTFTIWKTPNNIFLTKYSQIQSSIDIQGTGYSWNVNDKGIIGYESKVKIMTIRGLDKDFSMTWRGQDWSFQESIHVGVCSTNWQFLEKNCLNETFFLIFQTRRKLGWLDSVEVTWFLPLLKVCNSWN